MRTEAGLTVGLWMTSRIRLAAEHETGRDRVARPEGAADIGRSGHDAVLRELFRQHPGQLEIERAPTNQHHEPNETRVAARREYGQRPLDVCPEHRPFRPSPDRDYALHSRIARHRI